MTSQSAPRLNDRTLHDAAVWHARLLQPAATDAVWLDFIRWLEADDGHRRAYGLIEQLYDDLAPLADAGMPLIMDSSPRRDATRWWPGLAAAGGACLLALVTAGGIGRFGHRLPPAATLTAPVRYATAAGATRRLHLPDATVLDLNSATQVSVDFTARGRAVRLASGEALFRIAPDPARPFTVTAGSLTLRDIGTVFDVIRGAGRTTVVVVSGSVAASQGGGGATLVTLHAGDRLVQLDNAGATVQRVEPAALISWAEGYLVYDNASLSQVVADLNRRFAHQIALPDPQTGAQKFSGALKLDGEAAVLKRLTELLPLSLDPQGDGSVILRPRRN